MVTLPSAPVPALGKSVTPSRNPHLTMTTTTASSSSFLSSLSFWPRRAAASQHSRRCKRSVFLQDHLWCRASRAGCVAQNQFERHALPSCPGVLGTLCLLSTDGLHIALLFLNPASLFLLSPTQATNCCCTFTRKRMGPTGFRTNRASPSIVSPTRRACIATLKPRIPSVARAGPKYVTRCLSCDSGPASALRTRRNERF